MTGGESGSMQGLRAVAIPRRDVVVCTEALGGEAHGLCVADHGVDGVDADEQLQVRGPQPAEGVILIGTLNDGAYAVAALWAGIKNPSLGALGTLDSVGGRLSLQLGACSVVPGWRGSLLWCKDMGSTRSGVVLFPGS